jgi:hypothetical protein
MLQIATNNALILDGKATGLSLVQRREGTVVYTPENRLNGESYREHKMPNARYSTAHDAPASGAAGRAQLEDDLRKLLVALGTP